MTMDDARLLPLGTGLLWWRSGKEAWASKYHAHVILTGFTKKRLLVRTHCEGITRADPKHCIVDTKKSTNLG